jgi:PAS domain S-box-containing protein
MMWAIIGLVYSGLYAALMWALDDRAHLRMLIGNVALLLPPLAPLVVIVWRRHRWTGRQAVFWGAIGMWAGLWLIGQIGWVVDEAVRGAPLPWFRWHIVVQLSGSALPLIALVAWPHRRSSPETAVTAALDIAVLVFLTGFLYWSLVVAPGMAPAQASVALRLLAIVGPLVRLASVAGLAWAALDAGKGAWADVYKRLALGMILAFAVLVGLSLTAVHGDYQTGSPADVGWMLPFWFAAWAAAAAPPSPVESRAVGAWSVRQSSPALLFAAILAVPFVGYSLRYLMPLGDPTDRLREIATAATLVAGVALVMIRLRIEQHAVEQANHRVRLLATACEQAGELIVIVRNQRIEYANNAFCRACGYSLEELESLPPITLVGAESVPAVAGLMDGLRAKEVVRATITIARKDGTTFQAAIVGAPIIDASGGVTHLVGVIRDITDELHLREQLVRGERLSAIGEFVSGVAHELNNPLQSIIGTMELILDASTEPETRADVERARLEAARAGRIVRNLLTFVRQSPSERLLISLNDVVQSTIEVRAYELEMAGIEVREDYATNLPVVLANREELQQVVLHLIVNAQQAMAEAHGHGVLSIRTFLQGGSAVIDVCDDGPGIVPELAGRVFEPFFTTKSPGAGTGLGLSLSFGIAKAHGGSLAMLPLTRGACFRLSLPGAGFPGPVSVH